VTRLAVSYPVLCIQVISSAGLHALEGIFWASMCDKKAGLTSLD
jgi:hypothetical protein